VWGFFRQEAAFFIGRVDLNNLAALIGNQKAYLGFQRKTFQNEKQ
jgi:hypothetical protein